MASNMQIGFEMRLPEIWNGRYFHQANGGADGEIVPAYGSLLGGDQSKNALSLGFAVLSSDAGHDGKAFLNSGSQAAARSASIRSQDSTMATWPRPKLFDIAQRILKAYYGRQQDFSLYGRLLQRRTPWTCRRDAFPRHV